MLALGMDKITYRGCEWCGPDNECTCVLVEAMHDHAMEDSI